MTELEKIPADSARVYSGFLGMTKVALVLVTIVLIAMAIFLA